MRGEMAGPFDLDRCEVDLITAFLFHRGGHENPATLRANAGRAFSGAKIYGQGFIFDDTDKNGRANPISTMDELIAKNPRNAERIFPYIGGEEVNDSPKHAHHRYVINFGDRGEEECRRLWPDLMTIVEKKVKPERLTNNRETYRRYWWQYGEKRVDLWVAIAALDRILVCTLHQEHWALTFLPPGVVFSRRAVCVCRRAL